MKNNILEELECKLKESEKYLEELKLQYKKEKKDMKILFIISSTVLIRIEIEMYCFERFISYHQHLLAKFNPKGKFK